VAVLETEV